jgi:siroheme synthase (precorrin-2 oxidase/ferrochelatase)
MGISNHERVEIISHLTEMMGSTVNVTLEIGAEIQSDVPDQVVRTVAENCRTC